MSMAHIYIRIIATEVSHTLQPAVATVSHALQSIVTEVSRH